MILSHDNSNRMVPKLSNMGLCKQDWFKQHSLTHSITLSASEHKPVPPHSWGLSSIFMSYFNNLPQLVYRRGHVVTILMLIKLLVLPAALHLHHGSIFRHKICHRVLGCPCWGLLNLEVDGAQILSCRNNTKWCCLFFFSKHQVYKKMFLWI